jgi:hypothetical protein
MGLEKGTIHPYKGISPILFPIDAGVKGKGLNAYGFKGFRQPLPWKVSGGSAFGTTTTPCSVTWKPRRRSFSRS